MALVPQVVNAVSPIPVVGVGGIFDGRGIAAALMLGAVGVNLGTRFITSTEAPAPEEWKHAITGAKSEDAIKVDVLNASALCRAQRVSTPSHALFRQHPWTNEPQREEARRERDRLRGQIVSTTLAGRHRECVLWAGQTAGGITDILPVDEIMRRLMAETETALSGQRRPHSDPYRIDHEHQLHGPSAPANISRAGSVPSSGRKVRRLIFQPSSVRTNSQRLAETRCT